MNNKTLIYSGIIIAFIAFFISGYFTAHLFQSKLGESIEVEPGTLIDPTDTDMKGQVLKPAKGDYVVLGDIGEVDESKLPVEMVFYVDLNLSFLNFNLDTIEKKILIEEDTLIYVGLPLALGEEISEEKRILVSTDELKKGRRAIINTKENVNLILEQDVFTAQEIKVLVSQEEYQNYLK
jgi:hypothetical protein